jgi:phosphoribosyl-AMP cyclohydrolase
MKLGEEQQKQALKKARTEGIKMIYIDMDSDEAESAADTALELAGQNIIMDVSEAYAETVKNSNGRLRVFNVRTPQEAKRWLKQGAIKIGTSITAIDNPRSIGPCFAYLNYFSEVIGKDKLIITLNIKDGRIVLEDLEDESVKWDPESIYIKAADFCSEFISYEWRLNEKNMNLYRDIINRTGLRLTVSGITTFAEVDMLEKVGADSSINYEEARGITLEELIKNTVRYNQLDFVKGRGCIPTIVQNAKGDVLYLQSTSREALRKMIETGTVWRYSKTQNRLLQVGSESGKKEYVKGIFKNCYSDTLLIQVEQEKNFACHDGYPTCFYRQMKPDGLFEVCQQRAVDPKKVYGK